MRSALEVRGITRRFGKLVAANAVSFSVRRGEICGFIGPNGAGKTTTMRIAATLDLPDEGDVFIDGRSVLERPREARHRLGFMPDSYGAYAHTTILDYLDFFARAYRLGDERHATIERLLDFTSLTDLVDKPTSSLSKGMKQRLCLAKTMLNDPEVLILDEPAAGLDPRARIELRELVRALARMDKAVLISSHILSELGEMCDSVVIIEGGEIKAHGNVGSITDHLRTEETKVFARGLCGAEALERALLEEPGVTSAHAERDGVVFRFAGTDPQLARLVASLVRRELQIIEVTPEGMDLEDVFLSLTDGKVQ